MTVISKTITFNESSSGWTSFWDYTPTFAFSVNGRYFTTKDGSIYEHYTTALHGYYYDTYYNSEVTLVLNDNPSMVKNFKTVNYEGSNGWEVTTIETDAYAPSSNEYGNSSVKDEGRSIASYSEGKYIDGGVAYRSGFDRKEGKYYANIKGNGVILREGSVLSNDNTSGLKGVFCTITLKTDETTDNGGVKNLFAVSSEFIKSS